MSKLLLLLTLISATPVLAESDLFGFREQVFQMYGQYFNNASKFIELEDYEMGCSEQRMASTVLKTHFSLLQGINLITTSLRTGQPSST